MDRAPAARSKAFRGIYAHVAGEEARGDKNALKAISPLAPRAAGVELVGLQSFIIDESLIVLPGHTVLALCQNVSAVSLAARLRLGFQAGAEVFFVCRRLSETSSVSLDCNRAV